MSSGMSLSKRRISTKSEVIWRIEGRDEELRREEVENVDPIVSLEEAIIGVGTRSATDLTTWPDVVPTAERTLENVDDVDVQE